MYAVIDTQTGATLAMVDEPNYIKAGANGCYVAASREDAQGVSVNGGDVYGLVGREGIKGLGTVVVAQSDAGKMAMETAAQLDYIAMMADVDLDVLTAKAETEVDGDEQ
ncbi:MAG: hypothetical protein LUI02_06705 [Clostridiales bacterium]|nr:hypothetical protein [Clostridiales bacterium]